MCCAWSAQLVFGVSAVFAVGSKVGRRGVASEEDHKRGVASYESKACKATDLKATERKAAAESELISVYGVGGAAIQSI